MDRERPRVECFPFVKKTVISVEEEMVRMLFRNSN